MSKNTSYPKEKIKILLLEGVHPAAVKLFKECGYSNVRSQASSMKEDELKEQIKGVHVLGIRSKTKITEPVFQSADKLIAAGCFCAGFNHVHLGSATGKGIAVFNSPFSNTRSVAELAIGLMIMLMRKAADKNTAAHSGRWLKESKNCYEIRGKTLGLIGYGHISSQVSVLAENLGMSVLYYDVEPRLPLGNAKQVNLDDLLGSSHIVSLHVPGNPATKNMMNKDRLARMRKGAMLLNLSRGDVMDVTAVKKALEEKQLGGIAIDAFMDEPQENDAPFTHALQGMNNVILTPHIGGSTEEAQENIGLDVAQKLIQFLETGSSAGSLSLPQLSLPVQTEAHRLLHIHENVPGVMSEINGILSDHKVNILAQYLKTNNRIGYVVLDVDKKTSSSAIDALKKVKQTIRVRSLY